MQGTQVATNYLNDQLKEDMHRDELVHDGKLTRREADKEADTWAEVSQMLGRCRAQGVRRDGRAWTVAET